MTQLLVLGQSVTIDPSLKYLHEGLLFVPPESTLYVSVISRHSVQGHPFTVYQLNDYSILHDQDQDTLLLLHYLFDSLVPDDEKPFFLNAMDLKLEDHDKQYIYSPICDPYRFSSHCDSINGMVDDCELMERMYSRKIDDTEEFVIVTLNGASMYFYAGIKIIPGQIKWI